MTGRWPPTWSHYSPCSNAKYINIMLCYDHNGSAHVDTGRRTGKTHSASLGKFKNRDVRRTTETQRGDVRRTTETQCVAQEQRTRTESTSNKTANCLTAHHVYAPNARLVFLPCTRQLLGTGDKVSPKSDNLFPRRHSGVREHSTEHSTAQKRVCVQARRPCRRRASHRRRDARAASPASTSYVRTHVCALCPSAPGGCVQMGPYPPCLPCSVVDVPPWLPTVCRNSTKN